MGGSGECSKITKWLNSCVMARLELVCLDKRWKQQLWLLHLSWREVGHEERLEDAHINAAIELKEENKNVASGSRSLHRCCW